MEKLFLNSPLLNAKYLANLLDLSGLSITENDLDLHKPIKYGFIVLNNMHYKPVLGYNNAGIRVYTSASYPFNT